MQAALVVLAAASKTKTSAGASITSFLLIGVIAVAGYYFFVRPRTKRQRQAREDVKQSAIGDRIVTIGGLVGTIVSESGDEVTVSTGNGVEVTYLRQAIGRKLDATTPDALEAEEDQTVLDVAPPSIDTPPKPQEHDAT